MNFTRPETEWDHSNLQAYKESQVYDEFMGGWRLTAEPCDPIYPDVWNQNRLRQLGRDPFYRFKSGNLRTGYEFKPPFIAQIICDIPQVRGVVPAFWFYADPADGVCEVDAFESTRGCRPEFYMSLHDSWEPGHRMVYHKKLYGKQPGVNVIRVSVFDDAVIWSLNGRIWRHETTMCAGRVFRCLLTLAVTEPIEKPVSWRIYDVKVK